MKNFLLLVAATLLVVTSCQKEVLPVVDAPIPALQNVTLKNGRLHFPDEASLIAAEKAMNKEEAVSLTAWAEEMGIPSMHALYLEVNEAYSHVQNEQAYREFMAQYEDVLYITPENSISVKGYYPFLAQVLNTAGEMYVGDALVKYTNTHKITIPDGDEGKLAQAINATTSTEEIQVQELQFEDMNLGARSGGCGNYLVWHDCYYGTHERIYGRYNNINGLPEFDLSNPNITIYTPLRYEGRMQAYIRSEYKGFLGIWYLAPTTITWSIGWGVESLDGSLPSYTHGTGWTAYNVSLINYSYYYTNDMPAIFVSDNQLNSKRHIFNYVYANLATPNISCSQNCP